MSTPRGRAARERDAERVVAEPVAFVREFTGPAFRDEEEARAHWAGRLDDERPGQRVSVPPEDRFCDLKPIIQRSRIPLAPAHTVWRLSVAYWRTGGVPAAEAEAAQARKARRQKDGPAPDGETLEALANQPLLPVKPQQPLDIGLFEVRLPEAPHIVVPMSKADTWKDSAAPSLDDFAALADQAFKALPQPFKRMAGDVRMTVEDFATDEVLDSLAIADAFELTGIYQGVNLTDRSVLDPIPHLSQVFLYRRPILDEWAERGDVTLFELVTNVLVHEIGHHFGLSDDDIHAAEDEV